jgi:hypothetical protein
MSLYPAEDERRIRLQAVVREWTKSKLLDPAQGAALEAELRVNVRRTNVFLRAGLALFTTLIVAASVALVVVVFDLDHPMPEAIVSAIGAVLCLALAHYLVIAHRFYRFGVEEALAVVSVVLVAIASYTFTYAQPFERPDAAATMVALMAAAAGGLGVYWRFGYVYAAIGAIVCAASVPFQLEIAATAQHAIATGLAAAIFVLARSQRLRHDDEYPGDDYALLQAAGCAVLYLTVNLHLWFTPRDISTPFYWFTYATIWAVPLGGLYLAIRDMDRPLLAVSLVLLLATALTNKPYLGWTRHEWDPMLLGVFLMGTAILVRRWLAAGANGQRAGFTAARILSRQAGAVTLVGTASTVLHPDAPSFARADTDVVGHGGRSGGGGASGSF